MKDERCKRGVWHSSIQRHQPCRNRAVRDGYCAVHHPDAVARRAGRQRARAEARTRITVAPYLGVPTVRPDDLTTLRVWIDNAKTRRDREVEDCYWRILTVLEAVSAIQREGV